MVHLTGILEAVAYNFGKDKFHETLLYFFYNFIEFN